NEGEMTDTWPPPEGTAPPFNAWPPPQPTVPTPAVPAVSPWMPPEAAVAAPSAWQQPQQSPWSQQSPPAFQQAAWPPPQPGGPPPNYWMAQKTTEDKALEWIVPINRSGLAIAAGYVSLFSVFLVIAAPVG